MKPDKLYKTTVIIWSELSPPEVRAGDTGELGHDTDSGLVYCSDIITEQVTDQSQFPKTQYFDIQAKPE